MSKPTIEDVMTAIAGLSADVREVSGRVMRQRESMASVTDELAKARADLLRVESNLSRAIGELTEGTTARFDSLDQKLEAFQGVVASTREEARDLKADVIAIHKGLVRSKLPGIPVDLPSEVRAKGTKASKPAARRVTAKPRRR